MMVEERKIMNYGMRVSVNICTFVVKLIENERICYLGGKGGDGCDCGFGDTSAE